ncbi:MarR family transcriptional regulator [Paenibacillus sp. J5C_2022]|uniref:MarR family winged helix-turn-helix transcriptional regulator n=1 Tax=Paenibacillus sp. J5C2022 TaxID=2977129 RepID=UPI0021D35A2A|nr:MarR family transcriptional regulator [Paenibacillus sp. J5C2022]MCU6710567.1 MarR family transcriptional regulator [Paenibacillus sp. J5C2022]
MNTKPAKNILAGWLQFTQWHYSVSSLLEQALSDKHGLSLKEFYMLYFLYEAPERKLRLQELESMVGLSQSAMSRLVSRFEARACGAMQRHHCDADRRGVYTCLTDAGREKVEQALDTVLHVLGTEWTANDMARLARLMPPGQVE